MKTSPLRDGKRRLRVCGECGEFCLCHEETCPNCDSGEILLQEIGEAVAEALDEKRIRCRFRYDHLDAARERGQTDHARSS